MGVRFKSIDPRKELKERKSKEVVYSMVDYEYIKALAQFALELHISHAQQQAHDQPQEGEIELVNLAALSSSIVHDHSSHADHRIGEDDNSQLAALTNKTT